MKYLNICLCLNTSYGIQGHLYNILAQIIHACIRLSSHCNFFRLKVALRHYQNMLFSSKTDTLEAGNKLKWKIDTFNPKNQQKYVGNIGKWFVLYNYKPHIICVITLWCVANLDAICHVSGSVDFTLLPYTRVTRRSILINKTLIFVKNTLFKNIHGFMVLLQQILKYVLDRNFSTSNSVP